MLLVALIVVLVGANIFSVQVLAVSSEDQPSCFFTAITKLQQCFTAPPTEEELTYKKYQSKTASIFSFPGSNAEMEDAFAMEENIGNFGISLYGVFDGHNGAFTAKYTAKNLLTKLKSKIKEIKKNISKGCLADYTCDGKINYQVFFNKEISAFDEELRGILLDQKDASGTAAIIALIDGEQLYVVNLGNSRAVMSEVNGNVIALSEDLEPDKEKCRIENANGETLSAWQSLGNHDFIVRPDFGVKNQSIRKSQFIILASSGLWDKFSNEQAVQFINDEIEEDLFGAGKLALRAKEMGSTGNITIMVIKTLIKS